MRAEGNKNENIEHFTFNDNDNFLDWVFFNCNQILGWYAKFLLKIILQFLLEKNKCKTELEDHA